MFNDKDLKEYLLGHKPRIGYGLYALKGLTHEKLERWTQEYVESVENYVNEAIFRLSEKN